MHSARVSNFSAFGRPAAWHRGKSCGPYTGGASGRIRLCSHTAGRPVSGCKQHLSCRSQSSTADPDSDKPYGKTSLEDLKDRLELSIRAEDYKGAAAIRDAINQRVSEVEYAVETAHSQFYKAFGSGDFKAMDSVWGQGIYVKVMHPGLKPIYGRADVMESWRLILSTGGMNVRLEQVQIHTMDNLAMVTCIEDMRSDGGAGRIAATNILEKQNGKWLMIHHQGGPLQPQAL